MFKPVNVFHEIVEHSADDPSLWMQLTDQVQMRPTMFDCSNGAWSNVLRIVPGGRLACHYHTAPVHGFVVKGAWRYLEHDWVAHEGTYIYEPPGEIHTLAADEKLGMTTFFVTRGSLIYTDAKGVQIGYEDVFTRLAQFREHLSKGKLDAGIADRLIR